jgi:hypothetical protein
MEKGNARYRYVLVNEKHAAEEKAWARRFEEV